MTCINNGFVLCIRSFQFKKTAGTAHCAKTSCEVSNGKSVAVVKPQSVQAVSNHEKS